MRIAFPPVLPEVGFELVEDPLLRFLAGVGPLVFAAHHLANGVAGDSGFAGGWLRRRAPRRSSPRTGLPSVRAETRKSPLGVRGASRGSGRACSSPPAGRRRRAGPPWRCVRTTRGLPPLAAGGKQSVADECFEHVQPLRAFAARPQARESEAVKPEPVPQLQRQPAAAPLARTGAFELAQAQPQAAFGKRLGHGCVVGKEMELAGFTFVDLLDGSAPLQALQPTLMSASGPKVGSFGPQRVAVGFTGQIELAAAIFHAPGGLKNPRRCGDRRRSRSRRTGPCR